jgi:flagella basal body P-ring formation protein FlgA
MIDRLRRLAALLALIVALAAAAPARADGMIAVPVLIEAVGLGATIEAENVTWVELPFGKVPRNAILDAGGLIGMAPKRLIRPAAPVREGDVAPPILVERNAVVMMVFARAGLRLTAKGKALENGAEGDIIRVQNLQSELVIQGLVLPDGRVEVGLAGEFALN